MGVQAALLQKAYQIIDARLSDPDLSMRKVSVELKISLRYLYKLFASSGEGFGRYIKRRRLERCRCDLSNPIYANFKVSEICFRWGFNEAAHFSRVFREQYGMSPRSWRKEADAKRLADLASHPAPEGQSVRPRARGDEPGSAVDSGRIANRKFSDPIPASASARPSSRSS